MAARQRYGQPMDRAEVKRSARGEDVAASFHGTTTPSQILATTPPLFFEKGKQVSGAIKNLSASAWRAGVEPVQTCE